LIEPSLHSSNSSNASLRESMFLWVANRLSFELAAFLANRFRWKLHRTLPELRAMLGELREAYIRGNGGTRRETRARTRRRKSGRCGGCA
jgi:hypothetical protein